MMSSFVKCKPHSGARRQQTHVGRDRGLHKSDRLGSIRKCWSSRCASGSRASVSQVPTDSGRGNGVVVVLGCATAEGPMTEKRELAAILAADVVGFSRLTGADEDARAASGIAQSIPPLPCTTGMYSSAPGAAPAPQAAREEKVSVNGYWPPAFSKQAISTPPSPVA